MPTSPLPIQVTARPAPRARDRVREVLTCPFCRDGVARLDAVGCRRDGCGAVYHQACWDTCLRDYGACAVFGCACREVRPISRLGLWWRGLRLLIAALLYSPRVIEALRSKDAVSHATDWGRVLDEARLLHQETWSPAAYTPAARRRHGLTSLAQLLLALLFSALNTWAAATLFAEPMVLGLPIAVCIAVAAFFSGPFVTYALMALATVALVAARHGVLAGEFTALGRADGGETVIARMARAVGKPTRGG